MNIEQKIVIYGTGREAEYWIFQHLDIFQRIKFCIDAVKKGNFHGIPILAPCEVTNNQLQDVLIIIAAGSKKTFDEIANNLKERGLCEFYDFVWNKVFNGKKIVMINGNCHGTAITKRLQTSKSFMSRYDFYPIPAIQYNSQVLSEEVLKHIDLYIHQDIRTENRYNRYLSDEYVIPKLKQESLQITIPNMVGSGGGCFLI